MNRMFVNCYEQLDLFWCTLTSNTFTFQTLSFELLYTIIGGWDSNLHMKSLEMQPPADRKLFFAPQVSAFLRGTESNCSAAAIAIAVQLQLQLQLRWLK
jgi:hypothetical protein